MVFRLLAGFLPKHGRIFKGALERSSSTNVHEVNPIRGTRNRTLSYQHVVVTLDPNKFAEKKQQRFQIGGVKHFEPYITLHNQSSVLSPRLYYDKKKIADKQLPYPADTKVFLYYFTSPERPRIAGGLRFRVASSDDPASFESGSDLLISNGQPWSRPLYFLSKWYTPLYEKLREEGLVPDDLDAVISTFPRIFPKYRRSQYLYTLNDTFIVDFGYPKRILTLVTEQGVEKMEFNGPFFDFKFDDGGRRRREIPYTGSALVRFERSTLPIHKGTRTVVLRIVKIITPVRCVIPDYNGKTVWPKEGELQQRRARHKGVTIEKIWSINIDTKGRMGQVLRLLWDT